MIRNGGFKSHSPVQFIHQSLLPHSSATSPCQSLTRSNLPQDYAVLTSSPLASSPKSRPSANDMCAVTNLPSVSLSICSRASAVCQYDSRKGFKTLCKNAK